MTVNEIKKIIKEFRSSLNNKTIGLLSGTYSREDMIYYSKVPVEKTSERTIYDALSALGLEVVVISPNSRNLIDDLKNCDYVFNNTHGMFGEDGRIQSIAEFNKIKMSHPEHHTHAVCINKDICKLIVRGLNINTPKTILAGCENLEVLEKYIVNEGRSVVVKPSCGGSSVDLNLINSVSDIYKYNKCNYKEDGDIIFEEYIDGEDITVGIITIEDEIVIFPPLLVKTEKGFYSEDSKMIEHWNGAITYECPAKINDALYKELLEKSHLIYTSTRCKSYARIDFRLTTSGELYFLEMNTNPGMSKRGNFTLQANAFGITFEELLLLMIRTSKKGKRKKPKS